MVLAHRSLPKTIDIEATETLCQRYPIRKLALFGSVLRDDFCPDSDIDILVEFDPGHTPGFSFIEIQAQLADIIGRTIDLNTRRLSGKKSARGAALSTSQSLLRVEHYGLRVRQMAVIESWSEAEG